MLRVLIVEDEPLLAATLKHLIELNPFHQVTAVADDLPSALGCLSKPFSEEDLARTLRTAEDIIRGRERWRRRNPETLQLYCDVPKRRERVRLRGGTKAADTCSITAGFGTSQ